MSTHPMKPITKPGEGKKRQKYFTQEQYLESRYQISAGLKGPKRLENEFELAARKALNRNAMPAAGGMMVSSAGMDEFGNQKGNSMDDDLAQFMY